MGEYEEGVKTMHAYSYFLLFFRGVVWDIGYETEFGCFGGYLFARIASIAY